MRVLWSVNVVLPDIAKKVGLKRGHAISWVDAMKTEITRNNTNIELCIVCNGGIRVGKLIRYKHEGVQYYILPRDCQWKDYWSAIIEEFSPEIIHIYGTERCHNIKLIKRYKTRIPIVISLQGIISEYYKHYYAHIPMKDILMNYTLRDVIFRNGILAKKRSFRRQAKKEKFMLSSVSYVEGRSEWDKAISLNINPDLKYFYCPRMIRSPFFDYLWCPDSSEAHSIFVHQGDYPIKGLHFMIDALRIVKNKYADAKLYISGADLFNVKRSKERGYARYIKKKITQYQLKDSVIFTGYLDAQTLAEKLKTVNVCVVPSAIENAPNALAEAMIVGTPCVASYVGGNAEMLDDGHLGLLYCYYEPQMLARQIGKIFENPEETTKMSVAASRFARERHDCGVLLKTLYKIYTDILNDFSSVSEQG